MKKKDLKIGDKVQFVDKTGELLKGEVSGLDTEEGDYLTVLAFKKSWGKEVNCLLTAKWLTRTKV
jgi:hypothetical protein